MIENPIIYILNTHGVFLLFAAVLAYLWYYEKSYEEALHVLLASSVAAILAFFLKELFNVPRPYIIDNLLPLAGYSVRSSSLPSLHTAIAFALATTVVMHQKRFGIILLLIASLIGIGRVAANVHYPLDVEIGAIVGTLVSLLVEKIHIPYNPKLSSKKKKIKG